MSDESLKDYYPTWLKQNLVDNSFPWDFAQTISLKKFLEEYSFHDSVLIGIWAELPQTATFIVRWDSFWSKGRIPFPGSVVAEWPILLVHFPQIYQILFTAPTDSFYYSGIEMVASRSITRQEKEALLEFGTRQTILPVDGFEYLLDEELQHTAFVSFTSGEIHILHSEAVQLLCLNRQGEVISIPDL